MAKGSGKNDDKIAKLFVLVHGTWAPKSRWTQEGESLLCERLKSEFQVESGERIEIFSPTWSGKNRESHRILGGNDIANEVRDKLAGDNYDNESDVFFIAHSHGTDVAIKALQSIEDDERIRGLAAFNSPNILTLKRDFVTSIRQFVGFIKLFAIFAFIIAISLFVIFAIAPFGSSIFISSILFFATLLIIYILFSRFTAKIVDKLNDYSDASLKGDFRRSLSDRNVTPVLAINSSSDEAWNFLNLVTSLAQTPFFATHRLVIIFVAVFFFFVLSRSTGAQDPGGTASEYFFIFDSLTSYSTVFEMKQSVWGQIGHLRSDALEAGSGLAYWKPWLAANLLIFTWWLGAFSSVVAVVLLNVALFAVCAVGIGYLLALLVESFALGIPRWPSLEFLTTRKCIGLVPLSSSNLSFFDAGVGGSVLDHALPYNSSRVLDRTVCWIREHSRH